MILTLTLEENERPRRTLIMQLCKNALIKEGYEVEEVKFTDLKSVHDFYHKIYVRNPNIKKVKP
jgi:hypothetical protein